MHMEAKVRLEIRYTVNAPFPIPKTPFVLSLRCNRTLRKHLDLDTNSKRDTTTHRKTMMMPWPELTYHSESDS